MKKLRFLRSPFWVLDFMLPGRQSCVSYLRSLACQGECPAGSHACLIPWSRLPGVPEGSRFSWNRLYSTESRKEDGQSSLFSSAFIDCPGDLEGSGFSWNHLYSTESRKESGQSSLFSSAFIDCPGGIDGSRFSWNHPYYTESRKEGSQSSLFSSAFIDCPGI